MTYEQVEQIVLAMEAEGLRPSAAKILQQIGGSKRDAVRFLRQLRGGPPPDPDPTAPVPVPKASAALASVLALAPPQHEQRCPVVRYRVISRRFSRSTEIFGLVRITYGTVLDDVTPGELAAFPDVFECVEERTP